MVFLHVTMNAQTKPLSKEFSLADAPHCNPLRITGTSQQCIEIAGTYGRVSIAKKRGVPEPLLDEFSWPLIVSQKMLPGLVCETRVNPYPILVLLKIAQWVD